MMCDIRVMVDVGRRQFVELILINKLSDQFLRSNPSAVPSPIRITYHALDPYNQMVGVTIGLLPRAVDIRLRPRLSRDYPTLH